MISERHHFPYKFNVIPWFFNRHFVAVPDACAFKEVRILYGISTITVQCQFNIVIAKFQNKAAAYRTC